MVAAAAVRRVVLAEEDEERRRSHTTTSKITTAAVSTGRADAVGEAAAVAVTDAVAAMVGCCTSLLLRVGCTCLWAVDMLYMGGKGAGIRAVSSLKQVGVQSGQR